MNRFDLIKECMSSKELIPGDHMLAPGTNAPRCFIGFNSRLAEMKMGNILGEEGENIILTGLNRIYGGKNVK